MQTSHNFIEKKKKKNKRRHSDTHTLCRSAKAEMHRSQTFLQTFISLQQCRGVELVKGCAEAYFQHRLSLLTSPYPPPTPQCSSMVIIEDSHLYINHINSYRVQGKIIWRHSRKHQNREGILAGVMKRFAISPRPSLKATEVINHSLKTVSSVHNVNIRLILSPEPKKCS